LNVFFALILIVVVFEVLGRILLGDSFLFNTRPSATSLFNTARLSIIILQVSVIGIIAVGVTQVIITGGIDLSSGSVVGISAMVAASLAQGSGYAAAIYPGLTDLPIVFPVMAGLAVGLAAGIINGSLIAFTGIPPFIATLGMMVTARGLAKWYTRGTPVGVLRDVYGAIGAGKSPVIIFLIVAAIFFVALRYTRYGKFTYAIGANPQAARVSGINIGRHLIKVYAIAGLLSGLAGVVTSARVLSGQPGMGVMYELDAIAAAIIGGTSLAGGRGRVLGALLGALLMGSLNNGMSLMNVPTFYQDTARGVVLLLAVAIDQLSRRNRARTA
jgi:inositol transport system permease protein